MERLVEWNCKEKNSALPKCINEWGDVVPLEDICAQLALIYDILGDCDLDHLRELVEADKAGRVCMTHYKPGQEVWIVERFEDGEPDCVSGCVFVGEVCGAVIVHPFIGGCGDLDTIVQDCIDGTNVGYSCDLAMYPAADCYDALGLAEEALAKEVQPNDRP